MSKQFTESKKRQIAEKCNYRCAYCGRGLTLKTMRIDHFHPKAKGGKNHIENLMPCCQSCNSTKGTLDIEDFRLRVAFQKKAEGMKFSTEQIKFLNRKRVLAAMGVFTELFFFERIEGVRNGNH